MLVYSRWFTSNCFSKHQYAGMPHRIFIFFSDLFQVAQKCTHHYAQDDPEETAEKEEKQEEEVEEVHLVWFFISQTWVAFFLPHPSNNNMSAEGMKCCHFMSPHQPITVSNCWLKLLQPVARSSKLSKFNFYALSTMPFDAILQPTLPPPTCQLFCMCFFKKEALKRDSRCACNLTLFNVNFTKRLSPYFLQGAYFCNPPS